MRLIEARRASLNCQHAAAIALKGSSSEKVNPTKEPDPDEMAFMACRASCVPNFKIIRESKQDGEFKIHVDYITTREECILSPEVNENGCKLAAAAQRIAKQPYWIPINEDEYRAGKVNLNPLQGKLAFEE